MILTSRACKNCGEHKRMRSWDDRTLVCTKCGIEYELRKNELIETKRFAIENPNEGQKKKSWKPSKG